MELLPEEMIREINKHLKLKHAVMFAGSNKFINESCYADNQKKIEEYIKAPYVSKMSGQVNDEGEDPRKTHKLFKKYRNDILNFIWEIYKDNDLGIEGRLELSEYLMSEDLCYLDVINDCHSQYWDENHGRFYYYDKEVRRKKLLARK